VHARLTRTAPLDVAVSRSARGTALTVPGALDMTLVEARTPGGPGTAETVLIGASEAVRRVAALGGLSWWTSTGRDERLQAPRSRATRASRTIRVVHHGGSRSRHPVAAHRHVWRKGYYLGVDADWACMVCGRTAPTLVPITTADGR
jgi:hypothetical protein